MATTEKKSRAMIEDRVFDSFYTFSPDCRREWQETTQSVEVNCILLSKGQYAKNSPEKYLLLKYNAT